MDTINVLLTVPFSANIMEKLANVSPLLAFTERDARAPEEIADVIAGMDVLYTVSALPAPADAPRLRWAQLHTAGVDHVLDHPLYTQSEVMFTSISGVHAIQMTEYTFAMLLALSRRVPPMLEDQAAARWVEKRWGRFLPTELYGATLGIIGYGAIGRQIARVGQAFGMRVVAIKQNARSLKLDRYTLPNIGDPDGDIPDRIYPPEALRSFMAECDFVVVMAPLTGKTRHFIDAEALAAMKPGAFLINGARGDVIDEQALITALQEEKIGGAALDVFSVEPLPADSPLWKLPNTIISPHVGGFSPYYDERAADVFAENLRRFVAGEPLINLVERGKDY